MHMRQPQYASCMILEVIFNKWELILMDYIEEMQIRLMSINFTYLNISLLAFN